MTENPHARVHTVAELEGLSDDDLRKRMLPNLHSDERFAPFLEVEIVDQAYDVMKGVVAWAQQRAADFPRKSWERTEWGARQAQMHVRLGQLRNEIRRLNKEENESADAKLRRITRFAYEVAAALELRGGADVLELIKIDEDCTGLQFLNNYQAMLEKRAVAA